MNMERVVVALSHNYISCSFHTCWPFALTIRCGYPKTNHIRAHCWRTYERTFSDGRIETLFIREIIYGKRRAQRYWQLTTDKTTLPSASSWMVMTHVEGISYKQVGDLFGLQNWVEYGFKRP